MKKVIVSAPGKLHLAGEHAVVYGKPALVVATSLRVYAELTPGARVKDDPYVEAIIEAFEHKHRVTVENVAIRVSSGVPVGAGMGSSAALAVALIGALSVWHGFPWQPQVIADLSYLAEKSKHGNPSGSDPAVATHGGFLWYRKEMEFLKTLWLLPMKYPKSFPRLTLVNTGRSEDTGALVSHVARVRVRDEERFRLLLDDVESATRSVAAAIHDENEKAFRSAIRESERLLETMEIVSYAGRSFIRQVEALGDVAKISGAGGRKTGSGVVLVFSDAPGRVAALAKRLGHITFEAVLGGEGVKIEQAVA